MADWEREVLPVLRTTYNLMEEQKVASIDGDELMFLITEERTQADVLNMFLLLDRAGYVDIDLRSGFMAFVHATEKGLQTTQGWPIPGQGQVDALLGLLDHRIASSETPDEERTGLQQLRAAAGNVSQTVLASLLSAWLSQVTGVEGGQ